MANFTASFERCIPFFAVMDTVIKSCLVEEELIIIMISFNIFYFSKKKFKRTEFFLVHFDLHM